MPKGIYVRTAINSGNGYWSPESRAKAAATGRNRTYSEETRLRMSRAKLGGTLTEQHRQRIGMAHLGNRHAFSEETSNYSTMHKWARRYFISPTGTECQNCLQDGRILQWALLFGVTRKRWGWIRLCVPCHIAYDSGSANLTNPS